jgi:predicted DNA-binding transcriptional regulator AlpA
LVLRPSEDGLFFASCQLRRLATQKHFEVREMADIDTRAGDTVDITQLTGLTDKYFYKLIQEGRFPKPIKLGRSSRRLESEVEAWLQQRIVASRG